MTLHPTSNSLAGVTSNGFTHSFRGSTRLQSSCIFRNILTWANVRFFWNGKTTPLLVPWFQPFRFVSRLFVDGSVLSVWHWGPWLSNWAKKVMKAMDMSLKLKIYLAEMAADFGENHGPTLSLRKNSCPYWAPFCKNSQEIESHTKCKPLNSSKHFRQWSSCFFFKETLPVLEHQSSHFLREHFPYQDLSTVSESFRMFFKLVTLITNRSWSKKCHSTSIHMKTCTKTAPESTPNKQLPRNKCFFAYSVSWSQVPSTELLLVDKFSSWGARPQFKHLTTGDVQYARIYIYIGYTDMKLYIHEVSANHHCSYFKSCRLGQFYDMSLMIDWKQISK